MTIKATKITDFIRLDLIKEWIVDYRAKAGTKATYELYAIVIDKDKPRVGRVDHAPTSADFTACINKKRISALLTEADYVVEFRGAWKSETEGKVVAYELAQ
jgi:hypothetical protein